MPLVAVLGLAVVGGVAWAALALFSDDEADVGAPTTTSAATLPTTTVSTLAPGELVRVDEVWLIDRGDDVYDWGVIVQSPPGAPTRSGVEVEVRLLDAEGVVVETVGASLDGVDAESNGGVAGRTVDPERVPVRLEFDIGVGVAVEEPSLDDLLELRAVEQQEGSISGRVRSRSTAEVVDVTMLLVWRDDAGDIVATVPTPISRVRPGVDARFEIDLTDERVPDRRPDDVMWVV